MEAGVNIKTDQMKNEQMQADFESSDHNRIAKMIPSRTHNYSDR